MATQSKVTVKETRLPLPLVGRGKVRDIYAVGSDRLLLVTTDRLSAFDVVLPNPIPYKGEVLNRISLFWFKHFEKSVPHQVITGEVSEMGFDAAFVKEHGLALEGRSVLMRRAKPFPIECVVRGYLAGSGWKEYLKTGAVCGHKLPPGLRQCEKLVQPLFTPATKAVEGHDENISFDEAAKLVGRETAERLRELSIHLYVEGSKHAASKGILIADTKFEFGLLDGQIILIDEVLTPDSSRFWPGDRYAAGRDQDSYDKQIVRNFLETSGWKKEPPAPELPADVVEKTSRAYRDVYDRLTGQKLI